MCAGGPAFAPPNRVVMPICVQAVVDAAPHPLLDPEHIAVLPLDWPMGTSVVGRVQSIDPHGRPVTTTLTAAHPVPAAGRGRLVNLNSLKLGDPIPERFLVGDGSLGRVLVGVDASPGSPLDRQVQRIVNQITHFHTAGMPLPEAVLSVLRDHVALNMGRVRGQALPWDARLPALVAAATPDPTTLARDHEPLPLGVNLPVVPLEEYVKRAEGYCLQQSILASLVLRRFNIPHRIVNGASAYFEPGTGIVRMPGHTWIQLETNRVLDPLAGVLEYPARLTWGVPAQAGFPSSIVDGPWTFLSGYQTRHDDAWLPSWRMEYDRYYILGLDP